ncbi:uncharacterized protein [Rutidosis leptorrhynchoides]|uniref:uncharacterized protein n=1 Tax=Rutidosis leptorrhynchoides TaxID=125765 RepID=UPI003A99DAAF
MPIGKSLSRESSVHTEGKINSSHTHGYLRSCPISLGAETLLKSKVDILCVQETRWRGEEAVDIGDYKLWFSGSRVTRNRVGIFIGPRYKDNIVGVGTISNGYAGVHEGFGYGVRNEEGCSILEFAVAHDLVVANSFFRKPEAQLATFHSGGHSTQIDYLLLCKGDLRACRDCKALTTWTCSTQHILLVMDLVLQRRVTTRGRPD